MSQAGVRRIVAATGNPHKVEEIAAILGPLGFEVMGLEAVGRVIYTIQRGGVVKVGFITEPDRGVR